MKKAIIVLTVLLGCLLLFSCEKAAVWTTDYDAALVTAKKEKKEILLYFTGNSWDGKTTDQRANILDTEVFLKDIGKSFILVSIDYPGEETEENEAQLAVATALTTKYAIQEIPTILILSKEGYVIAQANISEDVTTPEAYREYLATFNDSIKTYNATIAKVTSSKGTDKVTAIDELFTATPSAYVGLLSDYIDEICELDPENKSGLLGKYLLQRAYSRSTTALSTGNITDAITEFSDIAENSVLTNEEKQEAWYDVAYLSAMAGESVDLQIEYLQKAVDIAPDSEISVQFKGVIEQLKIQAAQIETETMPEYEEEEEENSLSLE